jgi:hypothetical protein
MSRIGTSAAGEQTALESLFGRARAGIAASQPMPGYARSLRSVRSR